MKLSNEIAIPGMIGGKISVESQINTGTTFKFAVPKYVSDKELVEIR